MGQTREQRVDGVCSQVAWLTLKERARVLWALLSMRADEYELPDGRWRKSGLIRPVPFSEKVESITQRRAARENPER